MGYARVTNPRKGHAVRQLTRFIARGADSFIFFIIVVCVMVVAVPLPVLPASFDLFISDLVPIFDKAILSKLLGALAGLQNTILKCFDQTAARCFDI
jgi:hypothetical protein